MNRSFFKSAAIGLAVSLAVLCILVLIGALIAGKTADPNKLITPLAFAILGVSAFAGGASAARLGGYDGLASAAVCGAMLSILHLAVHLALGGRLEMLPLILTYAGIVVLAFFGGIVFSRRASASSSKKLRKFKKLSKRSR